MRASFMRQLFKQGRDCMSDNEQPAAAAPAGVPRDDDYARYVEDCRRRKLPKIIENSSTAHAKIVVKNLLILAKAENQDIRLLSGRVNHEFLRFIRTRYKRDAGCWTICETDCMLWTGSIAWQHLL